MRTLKPKRLRKGELIGLITPASPISDPLNIERSVKYLEKLGYNVLLGKHLEEQKGYLAGTDEQRLEDLHSMFKNKQVKAVFCLRGGYGTTRLLDKIDYKLILNNPKIFVGYSDINALQMAFYQKTGLVSVAGPMLGVSSLEESPAYIQELFWATITSNKPVGKIQNPNEEKIFILNKGKGEGKLIGGNLSILTSLLGTEYFPDEKNFILLLEDINEAPYRIDRMLNHLRLAKFFKYMKGVILARFVDCYDSDVTKKTLTLNEVIADYFNAMKIPVVYNVRHGHVNDNLTLPFGIKVNLNASRGFIEIKEGAVS